MINIFSNSTGTSTIFPINPKIGVHPEKVRFKSNYYRSGSHYWKGNVNTDTVVHDIFESIDAQTFKLSQKIYFGFYGVLLKYNPSNNCNPYVPVFVRHGNIVYYNTITSKAEVMIKNKLIKKGFVFEQTDVINQKLYQYVEIPKFKTISERREWLSDLVTRYNKQWD